MQLYLIRHTSVGVARGTCYGWTDVPVSDNFEVEAEECRKRLDGICFDRVYTSPLSRASRLAAYCGYPDAIIEPRLREMHMGDWEMKRFDDIHDPQLQEYYNHYLDCPTRNGESFRDLFRRVTAFIQKIQQEFGKGNASGGDEPKVALFCHGGPIICALVYAGVVPLEEGYAHIPDYASVTVVTL